MPASRSARAMIFAPRSWPSRPGFATTTRIFRVEVAAAMRVILALGVLLGAVPPAAAAPLRLGTSVSHPVVDSSGGRVLWQPDAGSIRALDLGAAKPARALALPPGCEPAGRAALRGDRLALACAGGPQLLDLATGAAGPVPGAAAAGIGGPDTGVSTVGAVWAEGWTGGASVFFALDGSAVERGDGAANQLPDLDSAGLWRPLCVPLRRTPAADDEDPRAFLPYAYSPPLGLDHRAFDYRPLRLERCGRGRPLRLSRCRRACKAVHLGAGSVAWRARGRIRLYRGASRRRASWPARAFGPQPSPFPTRRHVVVVAGRFGTAYTLWSVRAPT